MTPAKAYFSLLALAFSFTALRAFGDTGYSNLPPDPPNYNATIGSSIYGASQDPMMTNTSSSIAMSWVSSQTGVVSSLTLGITFKSPGNGAVNLFLAENPVDAGAFDVFTSQLLLGQVTATDQFGSTDTNLTTLSAPAPLSVTAGNTYYLILQPADDNTSVTWHANLTGATSTYYFSLDDLNFTLAGDFDSDALQVNVVVPEASTWTMGMFAGSLLAVMTVRRVRTKRARVRVNARCRAA
jgi:hypothetical protein